MSPEHRELLALRLCSKEGLPVQPLPGGSHEPTSVMELFGLPPEHHTALVEAMAGAFTSGSVVERREEAKIGAMNYTRARWFVGRPDVLAFVLRGLELPPELRAAVEEGLAAVGRAVLLYSIQDVRL